MPFNELAWIDLLKQKAQKNKNVLVGIGDDCALVKLGKEKMLLKSDLFIEDIHFSIKKISFKTIGMRAVGRVLSDFAACAGIPKFIGVSAGIPEYVSERNLKEMLDGILAFGEKYKFSLIGGDTSRAKKLFLDIWGVGTAGKYIRRSTAREGDYIFLTGRLGKRRFNRPFEPRIKEAQALAKNFKINAMIDISDGFIIDLYRILKESRKGAVVDKDSVSFRGKENQFYRGEDYELIFTVDKKEKKVEVLKKKFYLAGRITPANFGYRIKEGNKLSKVKVKGYMHF